MATLYKELTRILRGNGWVKIREGKGSHEIWGRKDGQGPRTTVPANIADRHTANLILKQAGLDKEF